MVRGLLYVPVRLQSEALKVSLEGLERVVAANDGLDLMFYDDNEGFESSRNMLQEFVKENVRRIRLATPIIGLPPSSHTRCGASRGWDGATVDRIISIKNAGFSVARAEGYDYVVMFDADMLMNERCIPSLLQSEKDIIAAIVWTRFRTDEDVWMPNCWDYQTYRFASAESIIRLREAGIYEVGGVAAATLYSRRAVEAGVSFSRIPNLVMWGEDKHLSVRATCLGFRLYVDTHYPVFHMYRDTDVALGREWVRAGAPPSMIREWLDEKWESLVRIRFERGKRPPEGSWRRRVAGRLRHIAQMLDPK